MKAARAYKAGRPTTGWRKLERITNLNQVAPGAVCIMDSHQFEATNLVMVESVTDVPKGFDYRYARTDGAAMGALMFTHEFELAGDAVEFFRAERASKRLGARGEL